MKKTCNKCNQERELAEFYREKQAKDGLRASCRCCDKTRKGAYYKANPEQVKACATAYRKANPEQVKARATAYRAYHKEMKQLQEEAGFETC